MWIAMLPKRYIYLHFFPQECMERLGLSNNGIHGLLFIKGFFVVMSWVLLLLMGFNTVSENYLVFSALERCLEHVSYNVK